MSGSQQFLGRQLSDQAKALALLVEKMEDNVEMVSRGVPKFVFASDNIRDTRQYSPERDVKSKPIRIRPFLNGNIRIKGMARGANNYTSAFMTVFVNGINSGEVVITGLTNGVFKEFQFPDLLVVEGDNVEIKYIGTVETSFIRDLWICYDETIMPGVLIRE